MAFLVLAACNAIDLEAYGFEVVYLSLAVSVGLKISIICNHLIYIYYCSQCIQLW